ncbi:MAG: SGNH/GDSL hydrolase family protein, partial [Oscillospiraceae bacterium]|nr:SGNH/GDSL hydrolase family protein [Oscillospiraceae bacterium]
MKRVLALFLVLVLAFGMLPAAAFAAESAPVQENLWAGRSAVFVGDSITAGTNTAEKYYGYLEQELGLASVTGMGVGGSCISAASDYGHSNQPLIDRYQSIPAADLVMVFMGTNDYGHETPLGTAADTQDGTFYGALNVIVPALVEKHTSGKLVFVTPLHRYGFGTSKLLGTGFTYDNLANGAGASLADYVQALKEVCAKNGVSVIDLYNECSLDPSDEATRTAYMPDGLHLNAAGHAHIAGIMAEHIRSYQPVENEPVGLQELVQGNKFAASNNQPCRASSRINYYLKAGTVITLRDPAAMQWACAKTGGEVSSSNLGYFPEKQWTDIPTATVAADGWVGFTFKYRDETKAFDLSQPLSALITIEEPHTHSYEAAVTAPTCTEQGYTAHTCTLCGDSYADDYTDAAGHSWVNGVCTVCDAAHPNLAGYKGKVISVLGDSISTFAGYIPTADGFNLEHLARYPQDNLLTDVNEMWWMQTVRALGAKLGINDSWRGATVSGAAPVTTGTTGENAAMCSLTRIQNLGANGTPDVILFYGGTNDLAHVSRVGSFDPETAPAAADLTTRKWDNLADGYVHTLLRLRHYYPDAEIVAMLPACTASYYSANKLAQANAVLAQICRHYGVAYTDLRDCGITTADLPDGIHPDAAGMDHITAAVLDVLLNDVEMKAGENAVHAVTHDLTGAESSLSYYKGVTHGKPFVTQITGEKVTVSVTMGGADITDAVWADGKVSIPAITGDVIITAKGYVRPVHADHLQPLPAAVCTGVDLWQVLEHDAQYYTVSGWGIHSSGKVYSVTFPVGAGDKIYASSFGAAGKNGSSTNGIRVTWFDENGLLKTVSPAEVYAEFAANGCLTAPAGAAAVCVPVWDVNADNEIRLLDRAHTYENGICTGCGAAQPGPVITAQPADAEAKLGERYMVEVLAEGENLKYQWYIRNAGAKGFSKSSVRDNTYDDVMTTARAGREVYCVITDANGNSVTTEKAKLICIPSAELKIVTQPADGEALLGERYCVSVEAEGEGLKYQWYFRNKGASHWSKSSVTDSTYDDVMTTTRAGREVYCVITDRFGNKVTTGTVKLVRTYRQLAISAQPADSEAPFGEKFCVTVEAEGEELKYQWFYRKAGAKTWLRSGVRDNTYDDVMTAARANREVYCVITDRLGNSVTTEVATIIPVPTVPLRLLGVSYEAAAMGGRYCATVQAEGEGLTYQWYGRNAGSRSWFKSSVRDNTYDDVMNKT